MNKRAGFGSTELVERRNWEGGKNVSPLRNLNERIPPIHPGEFLPEDFMKPLGLSATALHVSPRSVSEIVREKRGLDAEMMLQLTRYFGLSARFWANMQTQYDLTVAEDTIAKKIRRKVEPGPRDRRTGELKAAGRG